MKFVQQVQQSRCTRDRQNFRSDFASPALWSTV